MDILVHGLRLTAQRQQGGNEPWSVHTQLHAGRPKDRAQNCVPNSSGQVAELPDRMVETLDADTGLNPYPAALERRDSNIIAMNRLGLPSTTENSRLVPRESGTLPADQRAFTQSTGPNSGTLESSSCCWKSFYQQHEA